MNMLGEKVVELLSAKPAEESEQPLITDISGGAGGLEGSGASNTKVSDDDINVLSGPNDVDVAIRPDVRSNDVKVQICGLSVSFVCNCFSQEKQ